MGTISNIDSTNIALPKLKTPDERSKNNKDLTTAATDIEQALDGSDGKQGFGVSESENKINVKA